MTKRRSLIAIVDDEESVCRALRRLFTSAGFATQVFTSGDQFLESVRVDVPDCVILDLHLPGLSGLDVQRRLQRDDVHVPAVVITGIEEPGMRQHVEAAGVSAYLLKPLDSRTLLQAVDRAMRKTGDDD
jgi:FixJ family two-component response regulator